ncbi:MAG: N-acetylmuramoyl-L-alanine amidase [Verrucomicrobia bacterium]|nr:N-acetylmuramoyl-L-alanine amidase [Verrucomicrobiota bacterium]
MIQAASIRSTLRVAIWLGALVTVVIASVQVSRWTEAGLAAAIAEAVARDPEREALKKMSVVLDAGHGGQDSGTSGNGVQEKDKTLDLTRRIEKKLLEHGIRVQMTRQDDVYIALEDRCAVAAKSGASVFVSIHLNASAARNVSGIETYYCSQRGGIRQMKLENGEDHRSELLADSIQRRACADTDAPDRGVRDSRLYVLQHASCPAVLVECGYLTNQNEARQLKRDGYKDKLAAAIANGIRHHLIATAFNPRRGFVARPVAREVAAGGS